MTRFRERYEAAVEANASHLCIGLDPDTDRIPIGMSVRQFLFEVVDATADLVCCYKPNAAYFEARGAVGYEDLEALIAHIPDTVPVLLDAKRGDVGHSARHYAYAAFGHLGAHAVTVNPYLGHDALVPFLAWTDRHTFVLCHTSNKGAGLFQTRGSPPLYHAVAAEVRKWGSNAGLVVGAPYPEATRIVRSICPEQLLLLPGVGAQDGLMDSVREARDAHGGGIIVNASRSVLYPIWGYASKDVGGEARRSAMRLRDAINEAR